MQNDNGRTTTGRQVVSRVPQLDLGGGGGAAKGLRNCQTRMRLCFNLLGRRLWDEPATKRTLSAPLSVSPEALPERRRTSRRSQSAASSLGSRAAVQTADAVEEAGGAARRCGRITLHTVLERTSTPSRIPNAIIARRPALINISPTLAFVPSPLS